MVNTLYDVQTMMAEWQKYQKIFHSHKASFSDALSIELSRTQLLRLEAKIIGWAVRDEYPDDADDQLRQFQKHLSDFKDSITVELLRNGYSESETINTQYR